MCQDLGPRPKFLWLLGGISRQQSSPGNYGSNKAWKDPAPRAGQRWEEREAVGKRNTAGNGKMVTRVLTCPSKKQTKKPSLYQLRQAAITSSCPKCEKVSSLLKACSFWLTVCEELILTLQFSRSKTSPPEPLPLFPHWAEWTILTCVASGSICFC